MRKFNEHSLVNFDWKIEIVEGSSSKTRDKLVVGIDVLVVR